MATKKTKTATDNPNTTKSLDSTFMHEQREQDAEEAKLGQAAKHVKECHGYAREAFSRLGTARLATSTHEAIGHDLERVSELAADIQETADKALKELRR